MKKLIILSIILFAITAIYGCQNHTSEQVDDDMTSISLSLVSDESKPAISFQVPSQYTKKEILGGSSQGVEWINPNNENQKIRLLMSGTVGMMLDENGEWDVTNTITRDGINWTEISSNKLQANFTEDREDGITGYGKVIIVPDLPTKVSLEIYGETEDFAQGIIETFNIEEY